MAGTMRVDGPALRLAQPGLDAVASYAGEVLRRLAGILDAEGACWGADEMGATFAREYVPATAQTRAAIQDLREGVRTAGAAVLLVAQRVEAAETRARHRFS
jgi:hypothetical protein